jgi:S-formylglutathione hydrolase
MDFEVLAEQKSFGGRQLTCRHQSAVVGCPMRVSLYLPPAAQNSPVPILFWLSGLTCTEENFTVKAGAQEPASRAGLAIVVPDTSPRGLGVQGESDEWDFGVGAGFWLSASRSPWSQFWKMDQYALEELSELVFTRFPLRRDMQGISGHSMGGHGALSLALKHPDRFRTASAFAPIAAPSQCSWGQKAFRGYLGDDERAWRQYDTCALLDDGHRFPGAFLVDQGESDPYLKEQLRPDLLTEACARADQQLELRRHPGYDHSYYFVATFMADHIQHHAGNAPARRPGTTSTG